MSITSPSARDVMRRASVWLLALLGTWAGATGLIMILDARILGSERAWQPARLNGHVSLGVYGAIYIAIAILVLSAAISIRWKRSGIAGTLGATALSIFLALCLVLEAVQSGIGWLGAVNYVFDATVFVVAFRFLADESPTGRS